MMGSCNDCSFAVTIRSNTNLKPTSCFKKQIAYKKHKERKSTMPRSKYSADFKAKVVLEVIEGAAGFDEIAAKYNPNPNMVRNWKNEFLKNAGNAFNNNQADKEARRKEGALEKEKNQMLKTIGQLTLERNFLQDCFRESGIPIPKPDQEK